MGCRRAVQTSMGISSTFLLTCLEAPKSSQPALASLENLGSCSQESRPQASYCPHPPNPCSGSVLGSDRKTHLVSHNIPPFLHGPPVRSQVPVQDFHFLLLPGPPPPNLGSALARFFPKAKGGRWDSRLITGGA